MPGTPSSSVGHQIVHAARKGMPVLEDEVLEAVMAFEKLMEAHEKTVRPAVWAYVVRCFAEPLKRMTKWPERSGT